MNEKVQFLISKKDFSSSTKFSFSDIWLTDIMTEDIAMVRSVPTETTFKSLRRSWLTVRVDKSLFTRDISLKISILKISEK